MRKIRKFSFKRMMAFALCLVMTVALCGCSMLDYKKAVKFYDIGAYQQAKELFAAMGYGDISFDDIGAMGFKSYYSFEDFGLVRQQLEDESISKVLEAMARISKNLIIALTEQEIAAAAAEYGISVDEMYAAFGAGGVEDYLALSLGMSVDELLYMIYNEQTIKTLLSDTEVTGAWYVKDGILYVLTADETERGEYNAEKDIIVLTGTEYTGKVAEEFTDEEINSIYPIELIHAYKIEPAA